MPIINRRRQVAFCWQGFYGSDACCSKCSTAEHWFLPTLYLVEHQVKVEGAKLQALLSHKTQWPYFHWQIAVLGIENVLIDKLKIIILLKSAEWMNAFNHRWPQIWSPRKQCTNNTPRRQRPEIFLLIFAAIKEWMNEDSHSAAS